MRKVARRALGAAAVVAVLGGLLSGTIMSDVDEPDYRVASAEGAIEERVYAPMLVAEVTASGPRKEAINAGFRQLADFIFGANAPKSEIAMTAPVMQTPDMVATDKTDTDKAGTDTAEAGVAIAMTAPVAQEATADGTWKVRFVMPKQYTRETLPTPINSKIAILEVPESSMAVIRFSGMASEDSLKSHTEELMAYVAQHKLKAVGELVHAYYNPPWTLPFLRRNEIMLPVETVRSPD